MNRCGRADVLERADLDGDRRCRHIQDAKTTDFARRDIGPGADHLNVPRVTGQRDGADLDRRIGNRDIHDGEAVLAAREVGQVSDDVQAPGPTGGRIQSGDGDRVRGV